jgi:hypothetical protein
VSHLARVLSTTVAGGVLAAGCLSLTASPAVADICLPPVPGLPPVCVPEVPGLPVPGLEPPTATTPTAITGIRKVGSLLTATEPTWSDATATTTYQWQQAGVAIPDATEQTYTVRPADVGKQITVVATGTNTLLLAGTSTSAPVTGLIGDAIEAASPPVITGILAAGQTLTAKPGSWEGEPVATFTYQWQRAGAPVAGATASTYAVSAADAGRALSVVVTATRQGYRPGVAASAARMVSKLATTTRLALPRKTIKQGAKGRLELRLTAAGLTPAGKVRVFRGNKLLATYTVRPADHGVRVITLPRLKPGKHTLTARYAGDSATKSSRSTKVFLKVLPRS